MDNGQEVVAKAPTLTKEALEAEVKQAKEEIYRMEQGIQQLTGVIAHSQFLIKTYFTETK